ncbi:hypothetical protein GCM10010470_55090 [Saccharopolyspora taberi]|uniref:Protein-L-isoaspartate O-methyltransferase n=2 Tax=Saccharopolyspora taberi TaxID=60895 RepID=A0ABN3VL94_9PSEU
METDTTSPDALRASMVDKVRTMGHAWRSEVERVLRQVPRHEFVPEADLETAYHSWKAVITHRFEDGASLSCASAPYVVAMMLDQLDVQPGNRVLEIGAGTGYNAALLSELTGDAENVTTIDIDADVTTQASRALQTTGYGGVRVVTGDGAAGVPEHAPYDRIIATVSPWDIPEAWWNQLAPGGRIVLPLRWRGQARSVAFSEQEGRLISDSVELCGFVYLVGDDEGERSAPITEDGTVGLHWDRDQAVDPSVLKGVFDQPRITAWSGVTIAGDESHDGLWLHMTVTDSRTCRVNAQSDVSADVCDPIAPLRSPALVEGGSLAYLTSRRQETENGARWELGAIGNGPAAEELTERLCDEIRAWSSARDKRPTVIAYPADTPDNELAATPIEKAHSRLVLTFDDKLSTAM